MMDHVSLSYRRILVIRALYRAGQVWDYRNFEIGLVSKRGQAYPDLECAADSPNTSIPCTTNVL